MGKEEEKETEKRGDRWERSQIREGKEREGKGRHRRGVKNYRPIYARNTGSAPAVFKRYSPAQLL